MVGVVRGLAEDLPIERGNEHWRGTGLEGMRDAPY